MKFYPKTKLDKSEVYRITWSNKLNAYLLSDDGKSIGNASLTLEEYKQVEVDNFDCFKELGYDIQDLRVYTGLDRDLTGVQEVWSDISLNESVNELPYGVFNIKLSDRYGLIFKPYRSVIENKNIIENKNLIKIVEDFFNSGGQEGRKNKLGALLYGPPGNGKTSEIMNLFPLCEELKMRIFITPNTFRLNWLNDAKNLLEQDRTIFVMEEITERLAGRELEDLLTFLDGENSWNNSVTIATTNHPEEMPANLIDRPGRFSLFIKYDNPSKEQIIELGNKFGFTEEESSVLSDKNLSFDYISFIMSEAKKSNKTLNETIQFESDKRKRLSETFKGKIGFN